MKRRLISLTLTGCLVCSLLACSNSIDKSETTKNTTSDGESVENDNDEEVLDDDFENNDSDLANSDESDDAMTEYQKLFQYGPLLVRDENNNWGYLNESGEYAIEPIFSEANSFGGNGLATVQETESGLWGIIDSSGNYVIEPRYQYLGTGFWNGLLLAKEPGLDIGYIDKSGEYVIEPQFKRANEFCNGFARVSSQTAPYNSSSYYMMGYIDTSGKRITEDIFPEANDFFEDRALVTISTYREGMYGYIDTTGNVVIAPSYTSADEVFKDGVALVSIEDSTGERTNSLIDKEGNVIFSGVNYGFGKFESGLCPVHIGDGYVYINVEGEIVLPKDGIHYEEATEFKKGYAAVMDAEKHLWGYIDTKGNWVASPQYVLAFPYQNGIAVVATELNEVIEGTVYTYSDLQFIDTSGKCIMKLNSGVAPIIQGGTKPILSTERIAVSAVDESGAAKTKMGLYDYNNNLVVDYMFDVIELIADDSSYAKVGYNGLYGLIDMDGNWLIQPSFTFIE